MARLCADTVYATLGTGLTTSGASEEFVITTRPFIADRGSFAAAQDLAALAADQVRHADKLLALGPAHPESIAITLTRLRATGPGGVPAVPCGTRPYLFWAGRTSWCGF